MRIKFLSPDEVDTYWLDVEHLYRRCVDKACHDEYDTADIYRMAKAGQWTLGVAFTDMDIPFMAIAFEIIPYPSGKVGCNVLAMGGKNLEQYMRNFLDKFVRWCNQSGINWIECAVSAGMERIHKRYGFNTVYRHMKLTTKE